MPDVHDETDLELYMIDETYYRICDELIDAIKAFYFDFKHYKGTYSQRKHLVLIPDKHCQHLPWESLGVIRGHPVSRMPSFVLLQERFKQPSQIQLSGCYCILNPSNDLPKTQKKFEHLFKDERHLVSGLIGIEPTSQEFLNGLADKDLFLYFGHGGTEKYVTGNELKSLSSKNKIPTVLLFGCSSGYLKPCGTFDPRGIAMDYLLAGRLDFNNYSPSVLGNLWDVTDVDIDRFAITLLQKWGLSDSKNNPVDLTEAVAIAREATELKYIVGAAPVTYGLPLFIIKRNCNN